MIDVLFWSGGKDSFLALKFYQTKNLSRSLKLLTTYDESTGKIPYQEFAVHTVQRQADQLGLDIILVELPPECPNKIYMDRVNDALESLKEPVHYLWFGDWYLQDIRKWREQQFGKLRLFCKFPVWQKELSRLLKILSEEPVEVRINAVTDKFKKWIKKGDIYNQQFVDQLPEQIDPMGEKGEFHTEVIFKS